VDKANGSVWPGSDITGRSAVDAYNRTNQGAGSPTYVDIGAYESPTVWFVKSGATGGDGKSWASALGEVRDALDPTVNTNLADGDEIWAAEGTYKPTSGTDRTKSFQLVAGVGLYGGFEGTDGTRDLVDYETTLSGEINQAGYSDNSYHVVKGANRAYGNADGSSSNSDGGGIYCSIVSPTINNCIIKENKCSRYGGGIYTSSTFSTVSNCFFVGNESSINGGGMCNKGRSYALMIINCVFMDNSASTRGGAISNRDCSPILINCTFYDNSANYCGGMSSWGCCEPDVTNSILWGNTASYNPEIENPAGANPTFSYSDVKGSGGSSSWNSSFGRNGGGNIDEDPCFINTDDADGADNNLRTLDDGLRLDANRPFMADSLCIDAGDSIVAMNVSMDIAGGRRKIDVLDSDNNGNGTPPIDMGAYECFTPKVSGGEYHALVLKGEGRVWGAGHNYYYQLGTGESTSCEDTPIRVHDGNMTTGSSYSERIIALDAGYIHSLGLDEDGYLWAWGANGAGVGSWPCGDECGQLGCGTFRDHPEPERVHKGDMTGSSTDYLENIVKIAAGRSGAYSLALDSSHYVWAWGDNLVGELGNNGGGYDEKEPAPVQVVGGDQGGTYLTNIADIDAGVSHSIAVEGSSAGGNVFTWGHNQSGQLGIGSTYDDWEDTPQQVLRGQQPGTHTYLKDIVDVAVACGTAPRMHWIKTAMYGPGETTAKDSWATTTSRTMTMSRCRSRAKTE
jgi:predicted outer membrane repeat protein